MRNRETFYECTYTHDGSEYRFHVRAWSAAEAQDHFRAMLQEDGVREPGEVTIRAPGRATPVLRFGYALGPC